MVIDAIPKIEQDLYIDDDLNSFMFADCDSENNSDSMVIDVKPKNKQVKRKVDSDVEDETKKIHISPPEDYVDIEKLNRTVIEISSDSEDEVTYTKTTTSHPRDRLTVKIKEQEKQAIVVGDNDDEMYCKQKGERTKTGPVVMPTGALLAASKIKRKYAKSAKNTITKKLLKQDKELSKKIKRTRDLEKRKALELWVHGNIKTELIKLNG